MAATRRANARTALGSIFISRRSKVGDDKHWSLVGVAGGWTSAVRCLQRACRNGSCVSTLEEHRVKSRSPRRSTTAPFGRQPAGLAMCTLRRFPKHSRHRSDWPRINRKAVAPKGAIAIIIAAVRQALSKIPELDFSANAGTPPPPLPATFFSRVWLGLAGVLHQRDIDEIAPHAQEAFGIAAGDPALRISNGASGSPSSFACKRSRR